jgi:hypothetical protein
MAAAKEAEKNSKNPFIFTTPPLRIPPHRLKTMADKAENSPNLFLVVAPFTFNTTQNVRKTAWQIRKHDLAVSFFSPRLREQKCR